MCSYCLRKIKYLNFFNKIGFIVIKIKNTNCELLTKIG